MSDFQVPVGYTLRLELLGRLGVNGKHFATCEIADFSEGNEQAHPVAHVTSAGADEFDAMHRAYALAVAFIEHRRLDAQLFEGGFVSTREQGQEVVYLDDETPPYDFDGIYFSTDAQE